MRLEPGLEAAFRYTVTETDTAAAVGSGEVPVLATPRVLALAEQATVAAVAGALEARATTVGVRVELDHLVPSPVEADLEVPRQGLVDDLGQPLGQEPVGTGQAGLRSAAGPEEEELAFEASLSAGVDLFDTAAMDSGT